jgi:HAD superfamily hydrolase (TIGR01459 family)
VLLLSNAPRRSRTVVAQFPAKGIRPDLYDGVLTSGDAARDLLLAGAADMSRPFRGTCLFIGPDNDADVLDDTAIARTDRAEAADFVLAVGPFRRPDPVEAYTELLGEALARRLPLLCANPDLEVLRGPVREICAGAIAALYESMGGQAIYFGKPHAPIYAASLVQLGGPAPERVLAVGDSLRTDIAGAAAAGIDQMLITSGIHAEALGLADRFADPNAAALARLCTRTGAAPTYAATALRW